MQPGLAVGPPVLSRMGDTARDYSFSLLVYGSLAIVAALALIKVKPRFWTPPQRRQESKT